MYATQFISEIFASCQFVSLWTMLAMFMLTSLIGFYLAVLTTAHDLAVDPLATLEIASGYERTAKALRALDQIAFESIRPIPCQSENGSQWNQWTLERSDIIGGIKGRDGRIVAYLMRD